MFPRNPRSANLFDFLVFHVLKFKTNMMTHMNLKLPTTDCLVRQDLCEGDGQTISEKPLTCLTLHIQSCKGTHERHGFAPTTYRRKQCLLKCFAHKTSPVYFYLFY